MISVEFTISFDEFFTLSMVSGVSTRKLGNPFTQLLHFEQETETSNLLPILIILNLVVLPQAHIGSVRKIFTFLIIFFLLI